MKHVTSPGLRLFSAVALTVLLAACGGSSEKGFAGEPAPKSAKKEAQELSERVSAAPSDVTRAVARDPSRLLGLDRANLTAILGAPRFVRRDSTVQLWRYRNKKCVLHVFFYSNDDTDEEKMTVHHYEAHNLRGIPAVAGDCVSGLLASREE